MSEAYMNTEKTEYQGIIIPEGFAPTRIKGECTIDEGLVITDFNGNEYVWIEVPKEIYSNTEYNANKTKEPQDSIDFNNIKYVLQEYTKTYKSTKYSNWEDIYYTDCGLPNEESYTNLYNSMLKSIYENGGFWIGRYETGLENEYRNYGVDYFTLHELSKNPVIKKNAYPYNWIRCHQAQEIANSFSTNSKTTSLMFGIQWDLVLKFLESKGMSTSIINENSTNYGNYKNTKYTINNSSSKYFQGSKWYTGIYQKEKDSLTLLSTGEIEDFKCSNIYDLFGNVFEWTLEYSSNETYPCVDRGGAFYTEGNVSYGSSRTYMATNNAGGNAVGFRIVMY